MQTATQTKLKKNELKTLNAQEIRDALNEQSITENEAHEIALQIKDVCILTAKIISNEESRTI